MKDEFGRLKFLNPMNGVCRDPATLMALGGSGAAATGLGTAATVLSPILSIAGALSEISAAKEQAAEHEREAVESEVSANRQAAIQRRRDRQRRAAERAGQIESGVYSGTALDLEVQNYLAAEQDAMMIEYQGTQAGKSARFRAAQARRGASPLKVFTAAIQSYNQFDPLNLSAGGGSAVRGVAPTSVPYPQLRP